MTLPEIKDFMPKDIAKDIINNWKRKDYISRDEYFMGISLLSAHRSKDPRTQVWACIVDDYKKIIWIGYNWFPAWCSDDEFPRDKSEIFHENKHAYIVHAEANAILNSMWKNIYWSTLYVALFPCNECMKLIIQSWIKHIKYLSDSNNDRPYFLASKKMADAAGIKLEKLKITKNNIILDFENYKK